MNTAKITWQSPSNIALIKYWGKHGNQLPNNASLSLTLSEATTTTSLVLNKKKKKTGIEIDFKFEGKKNEVFANKISAFIESIKDELPFVNEYALSITSENSFPHSAGIASSASSMSALALCLLSQHMISDKKEYKPEQFYQLASHYARLGSGSAARSVYPDFAVWGKSAHIKTGNNKYAIQFPNKFNSDFNDLQDSILIVNEKEKAVSSRAGHALMNNHPMAKQRYINAEVRMKDLLSALTKGDWDLFCNTVEIEALELHALMMTSNPSYILMKPGTLEIIERVRRFRSETKIPLCFTLDAGPNVHLLYPYFAKKKVRNFIQEELLAFCTKKKVIYDGMGNGPQLRIDE
jgi:diphosphomevalonate decarboxylase